MDSPLAIPSMTAFPHIQIPYKGNCPLKWNGNDVKVGCKRKAN
jgi:hypothetical protein